MKNRRLLLSAFTLLGGTLLFSAFALPAKRNLRTVEQPDGTVLTVRVVGDEYMHFTTLPDGTLLTEDADGFLRVATMMEDGTLVSSGVSPLNLRGDVKTLNIKDLDFKSIAERKRKSGKRRAPQTGLGLSSDSYPCLGSPKGLIILVEYSDVKFNDSYDVDAKDYFNDMINGENFTQNGGTGSALKYFTEQSGGKFVPSFDVLGPVTLPNTQKYYGANDRWGDDENAHLMVIDAIDIIDREGWDFSQYDTDKDGYIDNVYIFYAGQGEADYGSANTVWPHAWDVTFAGIRKKVDGVYISNYACSNEWDESFPSGVGTFVHEFSHVMGLPDLYHTFDSSANYTPDEYSVLDYGPYNNKGRTPPNYGAYEKNAMGWFEPIMLDGPMSVKLDEISSGQFGLIPTEKDTEFFLLENRKQTGWDKYIPNHGMLIWHIDYVEKIFQNNEVNNTKNHQYVDIVEANNRQDYDYSDGYTFPGKSGNTSFTPSTTPALKSWSGKEINLPVTDIREIDGFIYFDVAGGGSTVMPPVPSVTEWSQKEMYFVAEWPEVEGASEYFISVYYAGGVAALPGYDNLSVGNVTSFKVDRLTEGRYDYQFTVTASDGVKSMTSAVIPVTLAGESGIDSVEMPDSYDDHAEYFNLQGIRVDSPLPGSMVIVRRGVKTTKMIVR